MCIYAVCTVFVKAMTITLTHKWIYPLQKHEIRADLIAKGHLVVVNDTPSAMKARIVFKIRCPIIILLEKETKMNYESKEKWSSLLSLVAEMPCWVYLCNRDSFLNPTSSNDDLEDLNKFRKNNKRSVT